MWVRRGYIMYVKFKGIVPSQYVWKCTRLGFSIIYFLGRKFAHVSACAHAPHTHEGDVINIETWAGTSFTYISTNILILMYLHLLYLYMGYLFTHESSIRHNQRTICYKRLQGPVSLMASSQLVQRWLRFINTNAWYL